MLSEPWQRNLAALWTAQVVTMIGLSLVLPFFPLYVQELGVKDTAQAAQWAGAVAAAAAISMTVAQPFWGALADRWGRRPMVIRSMFGAGICVLVIGFVTSPEQLLIARFCQGALSGTIAAGNALVATSTPRHRIGLAMGLMQVAMFVGSSIGPLAGGLIADAWGFRTCFYSAAGLLLIGGCTVVLMVREDFVKPQHATRQPNLFVSSKALFSIGAFGTIVAVMFLIHFGSSVMSPVLSLFISDLSGPANAATAAGIIVGANGAMGALSAVGAGRFGDRVGHARIVSICLAGAALVYIPQAFVQEVWQLLALRMALGCFLGGLMPSANAILVSIVPAAKRGAAFGLSSGVSSASGAVGPLLGAGVAGAAGLRAVFITTGALYAFAFAWITLEFRRHRVALLPANTAAEYGHQVRDEA